VHQIFPNFPTSANPCAAKRTTAFSTGAGNYTDDITMEAQSYAIFVRSPHAARHHQKH
jgi:carbon-monoxide dehydrogenase large subunit